jgi:hypothetical protein
MIIAKIICMFLNGIIFCLLFFYTCKQPANFKNDSRTVDEYLITYKNGIPNDTVLKSKSFYDSNENLLKEINYYGKQVLQTIIYISKDTFDSKRYLSKTDSIVYLVKGRSEQQKFYNGKLIDEIYYDKNNNIVKEINYDISSNHRLPVTEEFIYLYDKNRRKTSEALLWNKDTIYEVKYTYTEDSLLSEKDYLKNKCCEGNQPIPADKILYEYDRNRNLIKEIEIVDRNIKRAYKDQFNGYYNKAIITIYSYDNQNRLINKKIYAPNFSENPSTKINELYTTPSSLSEEYIYKYN